MLENFKKAIFRALCLCCVLIGGGGCYGHRPTLSLFFIGEYGVGTQKSTHKPKNI